LWGGLGQKKGGGPWGGGGGGGDSESMMQAWQCCHSMETPLVKEMLTESIAAATSAAYPIKESGSMKRGPFLTGDSGQS